jgi:hypothetical protein
MPGVRAVFVLSRRLLFVLAGAVALLGGGLTLIAATVGVCAAVGVALYGVAQLFAHLFGISVRWGLVSAVGLLFLGVTAGALIHDLWAIRALALAKVAPTEDP